jgi:hypothetical protein
VKTYEDMTLEELEENEDEFNEEDERAIEMYRWVPQRLMFCMVIKCVFLENISFLTEITFTKDSN